MVTPYNFMRISETNKVLKDVTTCVGWQHCISYAIHIFFTISIALKVVKIHSVRDLFHTDRRTDKTEHS
jgi:hypothetical protein